MSVSDEGNNPPVEVFYSYADEDEAWRRRLEKHLILIQREGLINVWHHQKIVPGGDKQFEIDRHLASAQIILLLISPDFLASDAAYRGMKQAFGRYNRGEARVISVLLRPSNWESTPIADLQSLPRNGKPIAEWSDPDRAFTEIAEEIRSLLKQNAFPGNALQDTKPSFQTPRNPYKGLRAFGIDDERDFFGRERLTEEIIEQIGRRLAETQQETTVSRLLAIVGPSGSGKTSVVMAGVVPKIKKGVLNGSDQWVLLEPMVPGLHPIESLTQTLYPHIPNHSHKSIREDLEDDTVDGLHLLLTTLVRQSGRKVLLIIDQFEELFTQTTTEDERQRFLNLLLPAITEPLNRWIVLLVLRADFYDRPLQYPDWGQLIARNQVVVFPMEKHDLRAVIEQPAHLPDVQLAFEGDLVDELLFEVRNQPGALPLLQFTLDQLFQQRRGALLTIQAHRQIGGIKGALAGHAEQIYEFLPTQEHKKLARALFLRLINLGGIEQDATRRRVALSELILIDQAETVLLAEVRTAFTNARLLTANTVGSTPTIEISHEALIGAWQRLRAWLLEARDNVRFQQAISEDAEIWRRDGEPADRLYYGSRLEEALKWRETYLPSQDEDAFLRASVEESQRRVRLEEQRRRSRRTMLIWMGGILISGAAWVTKVLDDNAHNAPAQSGFPYNGHDGSVLSVAWSPNGRYLASASDDKTVQVCDAITGAKLFIYQGHRAAVRSVAWSPDSKHLASGSANTTVQIWDVGNNSPLFTYRGHTKAVNSIAWSPDGKRLASASDDATIHIWDVSDGTRLFSYQGHSAGVRSVAWSPDGKRLASAGDDTTVQVWSVGNDDPHLTYRGHTKAVNSIAWSPNSNYLASAGDDIIIQVWDASNGQVEFSCSKNANNVNSVAWSPDGKRLASAGDDTYAQIWDADFNLGSPLQLDSPLHHTDSVLSVAWSPDGSRIASASADTTVRVWDALTACAYHGHNAPVNSITWSPNGESFASAGDDTTVQVWDVLSGEALFSYNRHTGSVFSVSWSGDGNYLASAGNYSTVQVWDASNGGQLLTYDSYANAENSVAWSPDGKRLASAGDDWIVHVWIWNVNTHTGGQLCTCQGHTETVNSVAWSPDGKHLASASDDNTVRVWDAATGGHILAYPGHTKAVNSVAWSPNGERLASAGNDTSVQIWDAATGGHILTYPGHTKAVNSIAWSPNGERLASAGDDTTVQVWDASTGKRLLTYSYHTDIVNSIEWSPDGRRLASAGDDKVVRIWWAL